MRASPLAIGGALAVLGGLVAVIATVTSSSLAAGERAAADAVQRSLAGDVRIPFRVRRWAQAVALAAVRTVPAAFRPGDPDRLVAWGRTLLAVMDRESFGGDLLSPKGPGGVGDPTPRTIGRVDVALRPMLRVTGTADDGQALVLPADAPGWGRGLMQLDWASQAAARDGRWRDPVQNIELGADLLAGYFDGWALGDRRGWDALPLALASYNTGPGNVAAALKRGLSPDAYTHGKDYSSDVLRRGAAWGGVGSGIA